MAQQFNSKQPYLGARTYQESDKDIFYGRTKETDDLLSLIEKNRLTVLFGKTGTGKSSLLNASLFPRLRTTYYLPVYLRPEFKDSGVEGDGSDVNPVISAGQQLERQLRKALKESSSLNQDLAFKYDPSRKDNLLSYLSRINFLDGLITPVLVFDQFEEIFKFGFKNTPSQALRLVDEISALVYPENYIRNVDALPNLHVALSLREDFMAQLEDLKVQIPSIMETRYRLKKFNGTKAYEAITQPVTGLVDHDTAIAIIEELGNEYDDNYYESLNSKDQWCNLIVDPIILSIYCFELNKLKKGATITQSLVGSHKSKEVIKHYYLSAVGKNMNMRRAIEEELVAEDGKTKGGAKMLTYLCEQYGLSRDDFQRLEENHRILVFENKKGHDYVELTHDMLAEQIFVCRTERHKEEVQLKQRKKLIRNLMIVSCLIILAFIITAGLIYRSNQKEKERVEIEKEKAEKAAALASIRERNAIDENYDNYRIASATYGVEMGRLRSEESDTTLQSYLEKKSLIQDIYIQNLHKIIPKLQRQTDKLLVINDSLQYQQILSNSLYRENVELKNKIDHWADKYENKENDFIERGHSIDSLKKQLNKAIEEKTIYKDLMEENKTALNLAKKGWKETNEKHLLRIMEAESRYAAVLDKNRIDNISSITWYGCLPANSSQTLDEKDDRQKFEVFDLYSDKAEVKFNFYSRITQKNYITAANSTRFIKFDQLEDVSGGRGEAFIKITGVTDCSDFDGPAIHFVIITMK